VDIDALIAALGGRFDAEESVVIERVLREYNGPIPDKQLLSEVGLALAIHRRSSDWVAGQANRRHDSSSFARGSPFEKPEDVGILCSGLPTATKCFVWADSPPCDIAPRRRWRFSRRGRG